MAEPTAEPKPLESREESSDERAASEPEPEGHWSLSAEPEPEAESPAATGEYGFVAVYAICILLIIVASLLILASILRRKHLRQHPLNLCIVSLAFADLLVAVGVLPAGLTPEIDNSKTNTAFCKICLYLTVLTRTARAGSIIVLAVRFILGGTKDGSSRYPRAVWFGLMFVWTWALVYSVREPILAGINIRTYTKKGGRFEFMICGLETKHSGEEKAFLILDFITIYLLPIGTLVYFYKNLVVRTLVYLQKTSVSQAKVKKEPSRPVGAGAPGVSPGFSDGYIDPSNPCGDDAGWCGDADDQNNPKPPPRPSGGGDAGKPDPKPPKPNPPKPKPKPPVGETGDDTADDTTPKPDGGNNSAGDENNPVQPDTSAGEPDVASCCLWQTIVGVVTVIFLYAFTQMPFYVLRFYLTFHGWFEHSVRALSIVDLIAFANAILLCPLVMIFNVPVRHSLMEMFRCRKPEKVVSDVGEETAVVVGDGSQACEQERQKMPPNTFVII